MRQPLAHTLLWWMEFAVNAEVNNLAQSSGLYGHGAQVHSFTIKPRRSHHLEPPQSNSSNPILSLIANPAGHCQYNQVLAPWAPAAYRYCTRLPCTVQFSKCSVFSNGQPAVVRTSKAEHRNS